MTRLAAALETVQDHLAALLTFKKLEPTPVASAPRVIANPHEGPKRRGVGRFLFPLIKAGQTDAQLMAALRARFGSDVPASYPAWYRMDAVRRGIVTADFAKQHAK